MKRFRGTHIVSLVILILAIGLVGSQVALATDVQRGDRQSSGVTKGVVAISERQHPEDTQVRQQTRKHSAHTPQLTLARQRSGELAGREAPAEALQDWEKWDERAAYMGDD